MNILARWCHKIYPLFQPAYDKMQAWDLPPEVKAQLSFLWPRLSRTMRKKIWALVKEGSTYGTALGTALLTKIVPEVLAYIDKDTN